MFYDEKIGSVKNDLLWNISNIPDGIYNASYGSCNYGGYFIIEITTSEKD